MYIGGYVMGGHGGVPSHPGGVAPHQQSPRQQQQQKPQPIPGIYSYKYVHVCACTTFVYMRPDLRKPFVGNPHAIRAMCVFSSSG